MQYKAIERWYEYITKTLSARRKSWDGTFKPIVVRGSFLAVGRNLSCGFTLSRLLLESRGITGHCRTVLNIYNVLVTVHRDSGRLQQATSAMSSVLLPTKNKVLPISSSRYRLRLVCKTKPPTDKSSLTYSWKLALSPYRGCPPTHYICAEEVKKSWIKFWANFLFVNVIDEEER